MSAQIRRLAPASLTARLVATLVAVVVAATALVAVVTALTMRGFLDDQLDDQVAQSLERSVHRYDENSRTAPPAGAEPDDDGDGPRVRFGQGDAVGTLRAQFGDVGRVGEVVVSEVEEHHLDSQALSLLRAVPADGRSHRVVLDDEGRFVVRAETVGSTKVVAGQSSSNADEIVANLVRSELLLGLGAVVVAVAMGLLLVRRQLRPLREVAATAHEVAGLPLASGEIGRTVRVPQRLSDERSEVGQVGAALNTMLEHVEHALDERHRSEQQVRQFVADASHELRTPLATIHGYAELSRRTVPPDPDRLALAMAKVESEATRMSGLVEDLLLLARLDAGRPLVRDEVDLTKLVLESVADARVVGPDHRWLLELPDEPVVVPGDEQRLHQVVTNLIGNARRHTPPGTTVAVGVRPDGDSAVLSVVDDGPGMPQELARTAFERFTRGDSARTRESGGAGLGLSLVEAITTAHGGVVTVESRPGRTGFEVRLPQLVASLTG